MKLMRGLLRSCASPSGSRHSVNRKRRVSPSLCSLTFFMNASPLRTPTSRTYFIRKRSPGSPGVHKCEGNLFPRVLFYESCFPDVGAAFGLVYSRFTLILLFCCTGCHQACPSRRIWPSASSHRGREEPMLPIACAPPRRGHCRCVSSDRAHERPGYRP